MTLRPPDWKAVDQEAEHLRRPIPRQAQEFASPPLRHVFNAVREASDVTNEEMVGRGRHAQVVAAREAFALLAREFTRCSYPEIARALAKKSHSTIITAHRRFSRRSISAAEDPALAIYAGARRLLERRYAEADAIASEIASQEKQSGGALMT